MLLGYYITLHARYGQTLGKRLMRVRVIDKSEARGITVWQAIRRDIVPVLGFLFAIGLAAYLSTLTPEMLENLGTVIVIAGAVILAFHGWFIAEIVTMLFSRRRRAVHDFIAGTVVVRV